MSWGERGTASKGGYEAVRPVKPSVVVFPGADLTMLEARGLAMKTAI